MEKLKSVISGGRNLVGLRGGLEEVRDRPSALKR